jgi:mRNA interferase MazF
MRFGAFVVMSGGNRCAWLSTVSAPIRSLGIAPRPIDSTPAPVLIPVPTELPVVRGDVWTVVFGAQPEDPEQAFERPALIVSDDRLHHPSLRIVIVVPGTSTLRGLPLHVEVLPDGDNGLDQPTAFQVEQVRAVSTARVTRHLGRLDAVSRHAIDEILRSALSLD